MCTLGFITDNGKPIEYDGLDGKTGTILRERFDYLSPSGNIM